MAIDVFFAGMMLICLDGRSSCVGYYGPNTAWVVKADGESSPCERPSREETELKVRFSSSDFYLSTPTSYCKAGECVLPAGDVCVVPNVAPLPGASSIGPLRLPRIDKLDRRFIAIRMERLQNLSYVPTRIHFPPGDSISTVAGFPYDYEQMIAYPPVQWYRSDGRADGLLPSELADRLKVTYEKANCLMLRRCSGESLFQLCLKEGIQNSKIVFQNFSKERPFPDRVDEYDDLAYLLWYYQLGLWDTTPFGQCPVYRNAILLRCVRDSPDGCAYSGRLNRDTTFWPPMLGPR